MRRNFFSLRYRHTTTAPSTRIAGSAHIPWPRSTASPTLSEALGNEEFKIGAHYLAAGYYNLGLAARRTGHEAEAIRRFNEAIDALPHSLYGQAARRALKERSPEHEPHAAAV